MQSSNSIFDPSSAIPGFDTRGARARKMRVLVADDSAAVRQLIMRTLQRFAEHDYEFRQAENGRDALHVLASFEPDLVLCDLNMEPINGLDVLSELRGRGFAAPFGLISSEGCAPETRQEALARGASFVLGKPFEPEALRRAVNGSAVWSFRNAANALEQLVRELLPRAKPAATQLVPRIAAHMGGATVRVSSCDGERFVGMFADPSGQAQLARALLQLDERAELAQETLEDCMGELANMVAGNLKALSSEQRARIHRPRRVQPFAGGSSAVAELRFESFTLAVSVSDAPA